MAAELEDVKINVKIKISALWVTLMFIYIYVDYFGLYKPGFLEEIIAGKMGLYPTTQASLLAATTLMMIPSLMIFLSLALKAIWNRWTNVIVSALKMVVVLAFVIGESWAFYIFGTIIEVVLHSLIIWYAWKWPRQEA